MPLSVFIIKSVACNLVIVCFRIPKWVQRLLPRVVLCMYMYLVCGTFVQLKSREIDQMTSSLTFLTRNSILETQDSILKTREFMDTRKYPESSIESRGLKIEAQRLRLKGLSTYFWAVLYLFICPVGLVWFARYCGKMYYHHLFLTVDSEVNTAHISFEMASRSDCLKHQDHWLCIFLLILIRLIRYIWRLNFRIPRSSHPP